LSYYDVIKPVKSPYEHQKRIMPETVDGILNDGMRALFMEMATGKTKVVLDAAMYLYSTEGIGGLVVVAPKSVCREWVPGTRIGVYNEGPTDDMTQCEKHLSIPFNSYLWDGKYTAKGQKEFEVFYKAYGFSVFVVNIEAFSSYKLLLSERLRAFMVSRQVVIAADECFHADTMVDVYEEHRFTQKRIADIIAGDVVYSAVGISRVRGVKRRVIADGIVRISINGSKVMCSRNHPFFTSSGWVSAANLVPGDRLIRAYEAMRLLRGEVLPEVRQDTALLREELLCEMEDATAGDQGETLLEGDAGQVRGRNEALVRIGQPDGEGKSGKDTRIKPNEKSEIARPVFSEAPSDGLEASQTMREWHRTDGGSGNSLDASWIGMDLGKSDSYSPESGIWLSDMLQGGHSERRADDCDRSRREYPLLTQSSRRKEGCPPCKYRVDSVEVLEQGSNALCAVGGTDAGIYLYDLDVEGHPSFSIDGFLVHNSSFIKNYGASRTQNLIAARYYAAGAVIMTGTEIGRSIVDLYSQFEFLDTRFWNMDLGAFKRRYCIMKLEINPKNGRRYNKIIGYKNLEELFARIAPYTSRAIKADCLDLPPKIFSTIWVDITPEQKRIINSLKTIQAALVKGTELAIGDGAAFINKARQVLGGGIINKYSDADGNIISEDIIWVEENPPKLQALLDSIEDHNEQAIVWSVYSHEVKMIAKALEPHGEVAIYDGKNVATREEGKKRFMEGKARFFVGNPAAGAFGLNLQNCHIQYLYSAPTSPITYHQMIDRINRPGQTFDCLYISLVARSAVDRRVMELIREGVDIMDAMKTVDIKKLENIFGSDA